MSIEYLDEMVAAYVECALWAGQDWSAVTEDEEGETNPVPWDENYGPDDLSDEALQSIREDCHAFYYANREHLNMGEWSAEQAGHDFFLTRNHHGAGFWDRGKGKSGDALTTAAHIYGEQDFYLGDDGKLYVE